MNDLADPGRKIAVMIVDDHPLLREGLAAIIGTEADMVVVAQAGDGAEALECVRMHRPDVVLMDFQMPQMDGIVAMKAMRALSSDARIVILTTYQGDALALRALQAGANGYLLKSMARTEVLTAIRCVHGGRRYIPSEIASALAAHIADDTLTSREVDVLRCLAEGGSNRAIATRLFVSEDTVKSHIKSILAKLSASDRTQAVVIAVKRGVIGLSGN